MLDRCANDADETVLAEITTDFAQGTALTVVDGQVYWTTRAGQFDDLGTVSKVSRCGGPVTTLSSNTGGYAVALDESYVYWLNAGVVRRRPK